MLNYNADETGDRTPQMDAAENDASEARVAAGESAYNAAIDAAASQLDCEIAYETAYDECAARQRQAAERAYQDAHR